MKQMVDSRDHPVLGSLEPVLSGARHVRLRNEQIAKVAGWMAYETLPWPDFRAPFVPEAEDLEVIDFIFLTSTINFAFTDFTTHRTFKVDFEGLERSDSDAMMACLKRAYDAGVPILEGQYLARIGREEMEEIFEGSIRLPLLERRLEIFHEVGAALERYYQGRFHHFLESAPCRLYSSGQGLLERLIEEFPSFRDDSHCLGHRIVFHKRAQLLFWMLHARFRQSCGFRLEDAKKLTAFADYILPVALRVLGILTYHADLEDVIRQRRLIPAHSAGEIEIRAFTLWAMHLLTREINRRRPSPLQVIEPVVDARLWTHYHATHWPHHLTVTTAY